MKFINYLESIAGISIYPMLSLLIFFLFFSGLLVYAWRLNKEFAIEMKNIPLDEKNPEQLMQ